jgi:hypothetical protein
MDEGRENENIMDDQLMNWDGNEKKSSGDK